MRRARTTCIVLFLVAGTAVTACYGDPGLKILVENSCDRDVEIELSERGGTFVPEDWQRIRVGGTGGGAWSDTDPSEVLLRARIPSRPDTEVAFTLDNSHVILSGDLCPR